MEAVSSTNETGGTKGSLTNMPKLAGVKKNYQVGRHIQLKSNLVKDRGSEFNGAGLYSNACRSQTNERFYPTSIGDDPSGGNCRGHAHRGMRRAVGDKCYT